MRLLLTLSVCPCLDVQVKECQCAFALVCASFFRFGVGEVCVCVDCGPPRPLSWRCAFLLSSFSFLSQRVVVVVGVHKCACVCVCVMAACVVGHFCSAWSLFIHLPCEEEEEEFTNKATKCGAVFFLPPT